MLVFLAAIAVSCLAPGPLIGSAPPSGRTPSIEAPLPAGSTSECAAVACSRVPTSSSASVPALALAGMLAAAALVEVCLRRARRRHRTKAALPDGVRRLLVHPPQRLLAF